MFDENKRVGENIAILFKICEKDFDGVKFNDDTNVKKFLTKWFNYSSNNSDITDT